MIPDGGPGFDPNERTERLTSAVDSLERLRSAILAGSPWPLAERVDHSDETLWGPPEILAHLAEMVPYWHGELARLLDGARRDREPTPFGRVATDAVRVAIVDRDRTLPVEELLDRIDADTRRLARRLETLEPSDLDRRGLHPSLGELRARELVERFVLDHFEEHLDQLRTILPG